MKKTKDVSDEDEYSADDPEEVEGAGSEEEWAPEATEEESESSKKKRPQRNVAKKRAHSEEEEEEEEEIEDEEEEEIEDEEEEDDEEEESDSDAEKKPKVKRRKNEIYEEDDSYDEFLDSDDPPKDFTSGAYVIAKSDIGQKTQPTLWRIDGKALLQKYLPFTDEDSKKTLYKSTSTYSGWSANNKDKYIAAQVTFKVQSRNETVVELQPLENQQATAEVEESDN